MTNYKKYLLAAPLLLSSIYASAVPARLELKTVSQPDGTELRVRMVGDENMHFTLSEEGYILIQDADGYYRLAEKNDQGYPVSSGILPEENPGKGIKPSDLDLDALYRNRYGEIPSARSVVKEKAKPYPTTGVVRIPIFLVEYQDVKFSEDYDVKAYFTKMMTEDGFNMFGGTGSAREYFYDQSGGKFILECDVYGPVTLPENQEYYGSNYGQGWDVYAHYMVSHAAKILDKEVDFSQYDADQDGEIDFIYVFYAGQGEHNKGGENTVWPHAGKLKQQADYVLVDDVWLNRYACSNEMEGDMPNGLGPFVHEYSHILGLPDLYAAPEIIKDRDFTCGPYSVLDYGCYSNDSRTPPNYTAFERHELGWNNPKILNYPMSVTFDNISTGTFGMIPTSKSSEYYLIENRQLEGWDAYLPAHGMLVWHIDRNKIQGMMANNDRAHQGVDLIEANNLEGFVNNSDGFTFPGTTGNTSFTAETTPALVTSAGEPINFPVTDIVEEEGLISFDISGGYEKLTPPELNEENVSFFSGGFQIYWDEIDYATDYLVTLYRVVTNNDENISFYGEDAESETLEPVMPYYEYSTNGIPSIEFVNLPEGKNEYVIKVAAVNDMQKRISKAMRMAKEIETGINNLSQEDAASTEYYNLQGLKVNAPQPGNIIIEKQGSKTRKILVKESNLR